MDRALRCRRRYRRVETRAAFAPRRRPVCGLCVPDWRERSLDQASADVNGTAVFTASESSRVTEALTQLEPVMRSSIAALVLKVSRITPCMHFSCSFISIIIHLEFQPWPTMILTNV